jgi:predicted metal-dependent hydrolase
MLDTMTVRQMPFEFPEELDPVIIEGDPEQSFRLVAASLLLPHLEPYLIRSMRAAKEHVTLPPVVLTELLSDPKLPRDVGALLSQL